MKLNFSKIKCVWLIAVFCVFFSYMFCYLFNVNNVFIKLFPLTGIVIFAVQVLKDRNWYKKKFLYLGGLMMGAYAITILVNYRYNLFANCKNMYWLFMYFFLYYSYDIGQKEIDYKKGLFLFNNFIVVITLVCNILSVAFFCMGIGINLYNKYGHFALGYHLRWGRLYGITASVNEAGRIAVISFVLSFVNYKLFDVSKRWRRIYLVNLIISTLFLATVVSRGAYLTLAVFVFIYTFGKAYANMVGGNLKRFAVSTVKAVALDVLLVLVVIVLDFLITWGTMISAEVGKKYCEVTVEYYDELSISTKNIDINSRGYRDLTDTQSIAVLYARREAWKSVFMDHWIWGIGAANEKTYMELYGYPNDQSLQMHTFSNMMVFAGMSGFGIYMVFMICVVVWSIKMLIKGEWDANKEIGLCYLAIVLALTVYTGVMYSNTVMSLYYWLFMGCAVNFISKSEKYEN
ncbi:MAG: hypothetical protein NC489_41745 [Ruminococcus flavefaciens]|nr:hypothetical protein [Ruminococcus flavefaciens]